ncbi:DOMON domain-containing protein FRRS1L isoform X2 [Hemicordylus capensis]|uniref:DOMON domain-containing protein FRRS1L isoform X2 n=1 Tax=Hemicordylus capensis TaxID=884348 RepID=UPI002304963A|nr:DOMON domain-containing protein FRRS1L isoform X2 [Hemicordylus capensis]
MLGCCCWLFPPPLLPHGQAPQMRAAVAGKRGRRAAVAGMVTPAGPSGTSSGLTTPHTAPSPASSTTCTSFPTRGKAKLFSKTWKRLLRSYPFPTAPPVDPFAKIRVDDCGKTKGCFRYGKPGCNGETCDYFLSYRRIGADIEFELSAETDGWVAVGFSSDKKMGGDDVMACVHDDNGRVRIHHFYNVGQWAKEIHRNPARDEEGIYENNRVTCRFKRPVKVPRDETIVDLHLSWYYLFAWGPAIQGSITRHDIDSPPVSERVVSIYKYEDIFMPSAAYQTFSSPFCLLLIVALTFYLLMGTP